MTANKTLNTYSEEQMEHEAIGTAAEIFGRRLNIVLDRAGYPRSGTGRNVVLADEFNVSTSAARKWVTGVAIPTYDKLLTMSRKYNVSTDWFLGNDKNVTDTSISEDVFVRDQIIKDQKQRIEQLNSKVSKLESLLTKRDRTKSSVVLPLLSSDQNEQATFTEEKTVTIPEWIDLKKSAKDDVVMVKVNSDAMSPTLNPGDMVLTDMAVNKVQDAVYVMRYGDLTLIRRIHPRFDGTVDMTCDNSKYAAESIPNDMIEFNTTRSIEHYSDDSNKLIIIGKILWAIKLEKNGLS
jgi:phage repressor protein C with HTH and peptisase S24 domain